MPRKLPPICSYIGHPTKTLIKGCVNDEISIFGVLLI
jgi:hypothetical protein